MEADLNIAPLFLDKEFLSRMARELARCKGKLDFYCGLIATFVDECKKNNIVIAEGWVESRDTLIKICEIFDEFYENAKQKPDNGCWN